MGVSNCKITEEIICVKITEEIIDNCDFTVGYADEKSSNVSLLL